MSDPNPIAEDAKRRIFRDADQSVRMTAAEAERAASLIDEAVRAVRRDRTNGPLEGSLEAFMARQRERIQRGTDSQGTFGGGGSYRFRANCPDYK